MENDDILRAKFIRLQNGDDLVSEVVEYEDEKVGLLYHLVNPLKVVYVPTGSGFIQVAFMPWVFGKICDHQEFTIHGDDVLLISDVSDYMNEYYWENYDTYTNKTEPQPPQEEEEQEEIDREEIMKSLSELINPKRTLH